MAGLLIVTTVETTDILKMFGITPNVENALLSLRSLN